MQIILGKAKRLIKLAKNEFNAMDTALRVAHGVAAHHQDPQVAKMAKVTADAIEALNNALNTKEES